MNKHYAVFIIAIAELFATSLWFSANSAANDLRVAWGLTTAGIGLLTDAVQFGFIIGALFISVSALADRFQASTIFITCALVGAAINATFAWLAHDLQVGLILRFFVGFALSGIYPIGMKLIINWANDNTEWALGILVGMLTIGTALPHGLHAIGRDVSWQLLITASSVLAVTAALMIGLLGDGPNHKLIDNCKIQPRLKFGAVIQAFHIPAFRASALGYFGHMWELYAFWTIVPVYIVHLNLGHNLSASAISWISFCTIGIGAIGCVSGGYISKRVGSAVTAAAALGISGLCGFVFVVIGSDLQPTSMYCLLLLWGTAVIADSPQFSALSARACPPELIGSALAIQNSIGFAVTMVSITLVTGLFNKLGIESAWLLLIGPIFGLLTFRPIFKIQKYNR